MKLSASVIKNLKLLFRSKESAYTVIFGPILIILLVSFAFMGGEDYTMRVGAFAPQSTGYSERVIDTLNEHEYVVNVYSNIDECVAGVTSGKNHACLAFSEKEAGNGTIPVTFYLDLSRPNIIYRIAQDLSGTLDLESDALRNQLTSDALARMHQAGQAVAHGHNMSEDIGTRLDIMEQDLRTAQLALSQLANLSVDTTKHQALRGYQFGLAQNTRTVVNISTVALERAERMIVRFERDCENCSEEITMSVKELRKELDDARVRMQLIVDDTSRVQLEQATSILSQITDDLQTLQMKINDDVAARETLRRSVTSSFAASQSNADDMRQLSAGLQYAQMTLNGQTVNSTSMSTPVQTTLVNVATSDEQLSFTYPYLLVLVVMFIGMLLASILVVTEKTSRARFRNFTTPTSDNYQVTVSFLTAALLLIVEVVIILVLSSLFIDQPLHLFSLSTIAIVLLAIMIFTFLGMVIGHLSNTQEAAMISSISTGSVLLFVSNLIIPIEGMASIVQRLTSFNPYVVISELLKKSLFYGVTLGQISQQIALLLLLCAALLALTLFIQRRNKQRYFKQEQGILAPHIPEPLLLGARKIHDEVELLDALDGMTRAEFETLVSTEDNIINAWIAKELRNASLSRRLRTTSKEKMILRLDKHLRKHGKNIRR